MSSTVVPSCWRTAAARRSISSRAAARGGHGLAVAVVVRVDLGGGEAERTLVERGVQRRLHGDHVLGVGRAPDRALAHDEAAQRRVADQEAGVHRDPAVEAAQPLAERAPVPGQAGPQRGQGHALDPRHHPRDVVGVLGRRAAPARTRSCHRAPWSRRAGATGWRWGPRRAGRRSGCAGRRSPASPACRRRRSPVSAGRRRHRRPDRRRPARPSSTHVGAHRRRPRCRRPPSRPG